MPKAYAYIRVSTCRQIESPHVQYRKCRKRWKRELILDGYEWGGHFKDKAVSGRIPFERRKAGGELLAKAQKGDVILISRLDRMFRNVTHVHMTMHELDRRGIRVICLDKHMGEIDFHSYMGRVMLTLVALFAEMESNTRSERALERNKYARAKGLAHCSNKYGFRVSGKIRGQKKMVPWPLERERGRMIVGLKESGMTWYEIYCHLRREKLVNPRTKREYCITTIAEIYKRECVLREKEGIPNGTAKTHNGTARPEQVQG